MQLCQVGSVNQGEQQRGKVVSLLDIELNTLSLNGAHRYHAPCLNDLHIGHSPPSLARLVLGLTASSGCLSVIAGWSPQ